MTGAEARRIREARGHSQSEWGRRLGRTWQTVSAWENEREALPMAVCQALRLCDEHGLDLYPVTPAGEAA